MTFRNVLTASTTLIAASTILALAGCKAASPSSNAAAPATATETISDVASVALTAQNQAQEVLNKAIQASGGVDTLDALRNGTLTLSVRAARVGQGPTPDADGNLGNPSKTVAQRGNGMTAIDRFNGAGNLGSRYVRGALVDWIHFAGPNTVADVEPTLAAGIINQVNSSGHILLELHDRSQHMPARNALFR